MRKVRRSVLILSATGVVIGTAAFILAHTHQSLEVKPVIALSSQSLNQFDSDSSSVVQIKNQNGHTSSQTHSNGVIPDFPKTKPGKIREPGDIFKPTEKPKVDHFAAYKSKYGLLTVPTYDGSNQLTHPKVLYFANGWHGYRYWMSMTPYPYTDDDYENPSIVVSNDGTNWTVPAGLKNPVSGVPEDVKIGGHYSDPHLVMNGNTMELWYRYNPGNPKTKAVVNSINIYYKKTSTDGIHWSAPQKLLTARDGHYSMAVNYENSMYKAWYATGSGHLCYQESYDSFHWSAPKVASVPLSAGYLPYHQDIIKVGSQYCLLLCAQRPSDYSFAQFFASSTDGIHFTNVKRIYPTGDTAMWNNVSLYRSSMFERNGNLEMYLTVWFKKTKTNGLDSSWYITHRTFPLRDFLPPEPSKPSSEPSKPQNSSSSTPSSEPPKPPVSSNAPSAEESKQNSLTILSSAALSY